VRSVIPAYIYVRNGKFLLEETQNHMIVHFNKIINEVYLLSFLYIKLCEFGMDLAFYDWFYGCLQTWSAQNSHGVGAAALSV